MTSPSDQPARPGRSLTAFYITLGAVAAMAGLGIWLWKPVSARLAFHRLWDRGAYQSILIQTGEDPVRRAVYRQLLKEKTASPRLKERLEAHKLGALIDGNDSLKAIEEAFAREARQWLLEQGRDSQVLATVSLELAPGTTTVITVSSSGSKKETWREEDIPHKVTMSAVILLRDGEECGQTEMDRLRDGLCREFSISRERVAIAAFRAGKEQEPAK